MCRRDSARSRSSSSSERRDATPHRLRRSISRRVERAIRASLPLRVDGYPSRHQRLRRRMHRFPSHLHRFPPHQHGFPSRGRPLEELPPYFPSRAQRLREHGQRPCVFAALLGRHPDRRAVLDLRHPGPIPGPIAAEGGCEPTDHEPCAWRPAAVRRGVVRPFCGLSSLAPASKSRRIWFDIATIGVLSFRVPSFDNPRFGSSCPPCSLRNPHGAHRGTDCCVL